MNEQSSVAVNELAYKKKEKHFKVKKGVALTVVWFFLILMYLPIVYLIIFSFTKSKVLGSWTGFSWDSYKQLFSNRYPKSVELWKATWNTIWVGVVASLLSTILGTAGAIGMHYLGKKLKNVFNLATQLPIVNAEIVMALSLVILFAFLKLPTSAFSLIIGHMVLTLPFVVTNVQPKLEQMDPSLYEAALDLGASRMGALFKVIIPDIAPGILSGFMISMTLSLDDYVITAFTKPGKGENFDTLSTWVNGQLSKGSLPISLRSFTAVLFIIIVGAMIGYTIYNNKKAKRV